MANKSYILRRDLMEYLLQKGFTLLDASHQNVFVFTENAALLIAIAEWMKHSILNL